MNVILALPIGLLLSAAFRTSSVSDGHLALPAPAPAKCTNAKIWTDSHTLYKGETLQLHFQAPNAPYLGVIDPAGHFFYVVFPSELTAGKLTPLVDSRQFENMTSLSIPTASFKADPYIYGVLENQLVFTQSGTYTFILGDNLHTEGDGEKLEKVVVQYRHYAKGAKESKKTKPKHVTVDVAMN